MNWIIIIAVVGGIIFGVVFILLEKKNSSKDTPKAKANNESSSAPSNSSASSSSNPSSSPTATTSNTSPPSSSPERPIKEPTQLQSQVLAKEKVASRQVQDMTAELSEVGQLFVIAGTIINYIEKESVKNDFPYLISEKEYFKHFNVELLVSLKQCFEQANTKIGQVKTTFTNYLKSNKEAIAGLNEMISKDAHLKNYFAEAHEDLKNLEKQYNESNIAIESIIPVAKIGIDKAIKEVDKMQELSKELYKTKNVEYLHQLFEKDGTFTSFSKVIFPSIVANFENIVKEERKIRSLLDKLDRIVFDINN